VIVMTMSKTPRGGVDRVDIRGQVDGIQLEAADPPARPDSAATRSDSIPVRRQGGG
jgi:hypothetical protein